MSFHLFVCSAPGDQLPVLLNPVVPIAGPGSSGQVVADRGGDELQLLTLGRKEQVREVSRLLAEARGVCLVTRSCVNHRGMEKEPRMVRATDKRPFEMPRG